MAIKYRIIEPVNMSETALKPLPLDYIKSYLRDEIDNDWYYYAYLDYGVTGHVTSITTYGPNNEHLRIQYVENRDGGHPMHDVIKECEILYYSTHTLDGLLNIWQGSVGGA